MTIKKRATGGVLGGSKSSGGSDDDSGGSGGGGSSGGSSSTSTSGGGSDVPDGSQTTAPAREDATTPDVDLSDDAPDPTKNTSGGGSSLEDRAVANKDSGESTSSTSTSSSDGEDDRTAMERWYDNQEGVDRGETYDTDAGMVVDHSPDDPSDVGPTETDAVPDAVAVAEAALEDRTRALPDSLIGEDGQPLSQSEAINQARQAVPSMPDLSDLPTPSTSRLSGPVVAVAVAAVGLLAVLGGGE